MAEKRIVISNTIDELKRNVGLVIFDVINQALEKRGQAVVGVSGGSMPTIIAPLLSSDTSVDWSLVKFFVVDERMVPISDNESNTGSYLRLLPKSFANSFLRFGPIDDCAKCAENYAKALIDLKLPMVNGFPQFDLLLLGHGPDGHTCSLFPGHPLLKNNRDLVAYIEDSPKLPSRRITLTMCAVKSARNLAFISTGEAKADIIKAILDDCDEHLPATIAYPLSGKLYWFLDSSAASKLRKR